LFKRNVGSATLNELMGSLIDATDMFRLQQRIDTRNEEEDQKARERERYCSLT